MGTRSSTIVKEGNLDSKSIIYMYKQFDGYLSGHGADLKEAFGNTRIINGIGGSVQTPDFANGMSCLAAQIVAEFKEEIGGIYLHPTDTDPQSYDYTLYIKPEGSIYNMPREGLPLYVKVTSYGDREIYDGLLSEMPLNEDEDED